MAKRQRTRTSIPSIPTRVAIGYARASTRHQDASVGDQTKQVERWCLEHGYPFDPNLVWADDGVSGAESERPGLLGLLAYVQRHPQPGDGVVVVWARDRLTRDEDPRTGLVLELEIERAGWRLEFLSGQGTSGDVLVDSLLATVEHHKSGKENVARAQAATRGLINRALSGKASGRIPYGYARRVVSPDGRARVVPRTSSFRAAPGEVVEWVPGDPLEVKTVQRVFELYLSGKSTAKIAGLLNADRLPSPRGKRWGDTVVLGLLRNTSYVGRVRWNKKTQGRYFKIVGGKGVRRTSVRSRTEPNPEEHVITIEDHHEAIVDADDFEATQRLLVKQRRRSGKQRQRAKLSPLNGIVRCGCCGTGMRHTDWGSGRVYVCGGANKGVCERFYVSAEDLEGNLIRELRQRLLPFRDEILGEIRGSLRNRLGTDSEGNARAELLRSEAEKLRKKIDQATENLCLVPAKAAAKLGTKIASLQEELEEVEQELVRHETREEISVDAEQALRKVEQLFDGLEDVEFKNTAAVRALLQGFLVGTVLNFVAEDPPEGKKRKIKRFTGGHAEIVPLIGDHVPKQPSDHYAQA